MKLKVDWITWIHAYKEREIEAVFSGCPCRCFQYGLELGAGDGYQSVLLSNYIGRLVSTEINKLRLSRKSNDSIEYRILSAEETIQKSQKTSFDIIYSSNLLEHVTDPHTVLCGIHNILKDDGVTVHIMPTPLWKLCQIVLYIPVNVLVIIERITQAAAQSAGLRNILREIRALLKEAFVGLTRGTNATLEKAAQEDELYGNNPGKGRETNEFLKRLFFPRPHGASKTNLAEFAAFGRKRWIREFDKAGFCCSIIRKGPAASGYGLGWAWADRIIEGAGLASEYIYIAQKKGCSSKFLRYFLFGNTIRSCTII